MLEYLCDEGSLLTFIPRIPLSTSRLAVIAFVEFVIGILLTTVNSYENILVVKFFFTRTEMAVLNSGLKVYKSK